MWGITITIMNRPFRISGIVEHGKGGRKLLPIDTMGQMMGAEGKASVFYIKCDDPANENAVIQRDPCHARAWRTARCRPWKIGSP